MQTFISDLQKHLSDWKLEPEMTEFGTVVSSADGIVRISGLPNVAMSETLSIDTSKGVVTALVQNLERDFIGAVLLGSISSVGEGDRVRPSGKVFSLPVGQKFLGRVVNAMMEPIDGLGTVASDAEYPIERTAPGVMHRQSVNQPLQTGIKVIDALVPIGRGQRELIIGDRQTGKTTVAIDAILNQKNSGVKCIYVAIGQKQSKVMRIVQELTAAGAMAYTTVVLSSASDSASMLYISPYAGVTLAEYFMDKGDDVLIVYDDLSKHANAYREMSLLLRRPPGREAYPGDVFYLHSRLLERACRRNAAHGGGSITALPIVETQAGDISGYIPTNVISITDGQIFLESGLFNKGIRPAINPGLSVSRVGGSAQSKAMKKIAGPLKLQLAQYRELESFSQFDSDLDANTKTTLERGKRLTELLKQGASQPLATGVQVALLFWASRGYLDKTAISAISSLQVEFIEYMNNSESELLAKLENTWDSETETALKQSIETFATIKYHINCMQTKAIYSKMKSIQNIKKITKTMEMVSVSKMKRASAKALGGRSYAEKAYGLIALLGQDTKTESNLLKSRESGKTLVILIASDKGLCGGYNAMLYRELVKMSKETEVVAIGSYAKKITLRAGLSLLESFVGVSENVSDFEITEITQFILDKFRATDEYKDVFVLFGHILRGVSYESDLQKILPLSVFHSDILEKDLEEYTCEPSKAHIIETLIPGLIQSLLLQHMREARAAEHTARMVAMKSATDSATEYYNKLKLSFNRARQSGITAEIAEIVAGANALSE